MDARKLYEQISLRTNGSVYIGVVGPVRTGKSTFVKRFMEQLVLPDIKNEYQRERARDELPQSGSGKTIMTAEPKFVPEQPVEISPDGSSSLSVRLIDSVGYLIPGALGAEEDEKPRMVTTPWFDREIPMAEAAELGTQKVMQEHCSIGIVVTTDGTIGEIPRSDYEQAEQKAIRDMQATGKPFVVLVNSDKPQDAPAQALQSEIAQTYGVPCRAVNCLTVELGEIREILRTVLEEFPVTELRFFLPGWVQALAASHPLKTALYDAMRQAAEEAGKLSASQSVASKLEELQQVEHVRVKSVDAGTGVVDCELAFPEKLFYSVLSEESGFTIENDSGLMALLSSLSSVKREYDKIESALEQVRATGYGIVMPGMDEMTLDEPRIVRKNGSCAIQLHASAPSIHLLRADLETEIRPTVGDEAQSQALIERLTGEYAEDAASLWESNLFGKSVGDMVSEGFVTKIGKLPEDAKMKLRQTLTRMVNENTGGLICIIL